ncbi:MAG TPA: type I methionyl aminopeptidase [Candidatus Saccharimonadia bacterium]|nr:type I methionyl aminopeptidase [Candidatus Saccharimonadia bacterium]
MMNQVKTPTEIANIRISGQMLAAVLRYLQDRVHPGITTRELDRLASQELQRLGGQPAFLGYQGFPAVICISINDEVVHGIPGKRQLAEGDIVGLDFGVNYGGMITDGAVTVAVGHASPEAEVLLKATEEALAKGIAQAREGAHLGDISHAIESRLRRDGLGVIEEMCGHGVGHEVHEDPLVLNYGKAGTGMRLKAGMTIAIEPMATLGSREIYVAEDNWTIKTADGSLGAQFEHTVLITSTGAEILTR